MGRLFPSAEGTGFAARLSHRVRRSAPALVGASPPRTGGHCPKAAGRTHPPGTMEHDSMKPAGHQTGSRDAATLSPAASAMSLFRRGALRSRMSGGDVVDRRLHATLLVRNAGELQRHLGDAERADQRAVVDVAEMADAEVLAGVGAEARAVGDVECVERERAELVGVVALRP